jgi:hypothetical protein
MGFPKAGKSRGVVGPITCGRNGSLGFVVIRGGSLGFLEFSLGVMGFLWGFGGENWMVRMWWIAGEMW